mgnify:CR=1 FL=1
MKTYKDIGFIIKIKQFPESDKLVVILGKKKGVIESVAKGASKSTSKKVSSIDLLNLVTATFYETKGIDLLKEIQLVKDFSTLKQNKIVVNKLLYILELIDKISVLTDYELNAFHLLENFMNLADVYPEHIDILLRVFELKLLKISGYAPEFYVYLDSNNKIQLKEKRVVSTGQGLGFVTNRHSKDNLISDKILKIQRYLTENDMTLAVKMIITDEELKTLDSINRQWIGIVIEKRLKSHELM